MAVTIYVTKHGTLDDTGAFEPSVECGNRTMKTSGVGYANFSPVTELIRFRVAQMPARSVLRFVDASPGCMMLSDHAARSMI
jgi:hypothetical protein